MRYLREIRKKNGLSSESMADLLGVKRRAYQYYESGDRDPSVESLEKLEDLFGVSYRELLKVV
jgi:transcriptional regulator with XRE-family HTH domain